MFGGEEIKYVYSKLMPGPCQSSFRLYPGVEPRVTLRISAMESFMHTSVSSKPPVVMVQRDRARLVS
jgi:hypothetical protein